MDDSAAPHRKIIHIDMDAFFASVEQRDNPDLRGKPVAVGSAQARGVVAAASYEARVFGVRSAMPSVTAKRQCAELIFVPPRFDVYRAVSQQVRAIFEKFTDLIEPLSLDEAYLDVTHNKPGIASATYIAEEIRRLIWEQTGLTASAGVSCNKLLAKLASDQNKPNGLCVIRPEQGEAFVAALPVRRLHGIGPVTAAKMAAMGIETGADLRARDLPFLQAHFGKSARYYFGAARGQDDRPVQPDRPRKSVSVEDTFLHDLRDPQELESALERIIANLWPRILASGAKGRAVTLKLKFADFRIATRSCSLGHPVESEAVLRAQGIALLRAQVPVPLGVRLLGLGVHNLGEKERVETPVKQSAQLALAI